MYIYIYFFFLLGGVLYRKSFIKLDVNGFSLFSTNAKRWRICRREFHGKENVSPSGAYKNWHVPENVCHRRLHLSSPILQVPLSLHTIFFPAFFVYPLFDIWHATERNRIKDFEPLLYIIVCLSILFQNKKKKKKNRRFPFLSSDVYWIILNFHDCLKKRELYFKIVIF